MAVTRYSVGAIDPLMLGAFRFGIGFVFGLMVSWATFQGAVTELAVGWILVGTDVGRIGGMTVGEDGLYVVYEVRIAKCGVPRRHTKEGSDMPYIAHDTNVIYAAADTAAAARAEAEKDLRNRRPPENIDETLKSLEVHEATTALVNDSNSWVKWAYLKNGVACTPAEANDEDYRLGIAAATDGK